MNLPLHLGLLGALEAGLIAFLVALLLYALWHYLGRRAGLSLPQILGWSAVSAVVLGAGLDIWNLFYLGFSRLESPVYARLAVEGIHDVDSLGARVVLELTGVVAGISTGWGVFSRRLVESDSASEE